MGGCYDRSSGSGMGGIDCIDLVQDKDRWRALVNMIIKPSVSKKCEEFIDKLRTG